MGLEELNTLLQEHRALLVAYGAVQERCTRLLREQAASIQALEAKLVRQRAAFIIRETALAFGLGRHTSPRKDTTPAVLCVGDASAHAAVAQRLVEMVGGHFLHHAGDSEGYQARNALEASLVAADLVICQTGCLSHGAYWRVQDHCRRTGKQCVMVSPEGEQTQVLRLYRPVATAPATTPMATEPSA